MARPSDPSSTRLNDSPWFWLLLFSLMGLMALAVIGPKHVRRQQRLERMQQARQQVAAGQRGDVAEEAENAQSNVSLLPLAIAFIGLLVIAGIGIVLVLRRDRRHDQENDETP